MKKQLIYQQYDFSTMEEFFNYIIESKINGNHSQVNRLLSEMKALEISDFINWAKDTDVTGDNLQQDFTYCINTALKVLTDRATAKEIKHHA